MNDVFNHPNGDHPADLPFIHRFYMAHKKTAGQIVTFYDKI